MTVHSARWATVLAAVALGVVGVPGVGVAHGELLLTIHGDGRGSVWVTTIWQDGDSVAEPVAATLTATSSGGQRIGPVPLGPLPGQPSGARYRDTLPPGTWTVVAEAATPGLGRCEAVLTVVAATAAEAAPQSVRCGSPAPVASGEVDGGGVPWGVYAVGAVVALVGTALGLAWLRHR